MEVFVNLHNYEVMDKTDDYIVCDEEIAESIAILNKKGYKTIASCAGHNKIFDNQVLTWPANRKDTLFKQKDLVYIVSEDDKEIKYVPKLLGVATYVAFDKDYNFDNLPEGFRLRNKDVITISYLHAFYENSEHNKRKSDEEINKELKKAQKALLKWAQSLKEKI